MDTDGEELVSSLQKRNLEEEIVESDDERNTGLDGAADDDSDSEKSEEEAITKGPSSIKEAFKYENQLPGTISNGWHNYTCVKTYDPTKLNDAKVIKKKKKEGPPPTVFCSRYYKCCKYRSTRCPAGLNMRLDIATMIVTCTYKIFIFFCFLLLNQS